LTVEVKTEAGVECFDGKATTAQGQEHDRLLGILNATFPHMAEHQHKTEREIPSSSSSAKTDRSRSPRTAWMTGDQRSLEVTAHSPRDDPLWKRPVLPELVETAEERVLMRIELRELLVGEVSQRIDHGHIIWNRPCPAGIALTAVTPDLSRQDSIQTPQLHFHRPQEPATIR
jgi:hypothetical protein